MPKTELCHCGKPMKHVGAHRGNRPWNGSAVAKKPARAKAAPAPALPPPAPEEDQAVAMLEQLLGQADARRAELEDSLRSAQGEIEALESRRERLSIALQALRAAGTGKARAGKTKAIPPNPAPLARPKKTAAKVAPMSAPRSEVVLAAVANLGDRVTLPDVVDAVQAAGWPEATPLGVRAVLRQLVAQDRIRGSEEKGYAVEPQAVSA